MLTPKKLLLYIVPIPAISWFLFFEYIVEQEKLDMCSSFDCIDFFDYAGQFLFLFSIILIVINFSLIFLHKEIFVSWWKFARIYIPISAILTILSGSGRGGGYISLTPDYESTVWFTAGLFFIISLILIIYKSLKLHKEHNQ